jgi:thiamine transport system ATP-binding protein
MPHPGRRETTEFPGYRTPRSALCALTGPNGGGKTTFLNYIHAHPHCIECPNSNAPVMLDQMYERLLYPYQRVWWNIALPLIVAGSLRTSEARALAIRKLQTFELDVDPDIYPGVLSGGEKHLVLLLRMSLCAHGVLLLDEPAAGVDASRLSQMWRMISSLVCEDRKEVIITTHRDSPPWQRLQPLTIAGIRGAELRMETYVPKEME